ncbi:DUF423 domain-containing protein [Labilibacter sediminis]|nr:DUF423 domain-containing protein [Labilibacter sediminis]
MKKVVLLFGASYGLLSVVLGAFGAHALKKILTPEVLKSFETGVKYQMYHALVMLVIGFYFSFTVKTEVYMAMTFILGTFLFSFSIYLLAFNSLWGYNMRFVGLVTPLGGMLLIMGWILLLLNVYRKF